MTTAAPIEANVEFEQMHSWCVWTKNGRRPRYFHATRDKAETEARRLAAKIPGAKFIVMQVVGKFGAASVGTHPEGGDGEAGLVRSMGDAVHEAQTPNPSPITPNGA